MRPSCSCYTTPRDYSDCTKPLKMVKQVIHRSAKILGVTTNYRRTPRVRTSIPVQFDISRSYAFRGTILSLSTRGCLIQTGVAEQLQGRTIFIQMQLPSRQVVSLQGKVIYLHAGRCGVEFTELASKEKGMLVELVRHYRTTGTK
jgi:hypothetical protein